MVARDAAEMRAFNRFYTQRIGVLDAAPLGGPFSLTEARVLYELAARGSSVASDLCGDLGLDRGYLSRILARFEKRGLIARSPSSSDGRSNLITLSPSGAATFAAIDSRWQDATETLLQPLRVAERSRLVASMRRIEALLSRSNDAFPRIILRAPRLGEMGWVVERHAVCYGQQYGWNNEFEALVAEIVAKFVRNYDPSSEQCWIASREGAPVGCVFLVRESGTVGRLRLLLVDPAARGAGLGRRLVEACVERARQLGYRTLTLYTNDVLVSARRLYEAAGFRLVREWPHRSFGKDLVGQDWDLDL